MIRIVIRYGLILFLGLMAFFLLMQGLGFGEEYDYRIFNLVIQIVVIYFAIRSYARSNADEFNYLSGSLAGVFTTIAGVIPFAIFHMINLTASPELMSVLQEAPVIGPYLNPFTAGLIVLAEGTSVGLILSYICMRIVDWRDVSANKPYTKVKVEKG